MLGIMKLVLAIAYILMGMTAFAFQDTAVRLLAVDISILQVMFARSVIAIVLLVLFFYFSSVLLYSDAKVATEKH